MFSSCCNAFDLFRWQTFLNVRNKLRQYAANNIEFRIQLLLVCAGCLDAESGWFDMRAMSNVYYSNIRVGFVACVTAALSALSNGTVDGRGENRHSREQVAMHLFDKPQIFHRSITDSEWWVQFPFAIRKRHWKPLILRVIWFVSYISACVQLVQISAIFYY